VWLKFGTVFLARLFLRDRPGKNDLGPDPRPSRFNPAVERRRHPAQRGMPDLPLHVGKHLTGISLVPAPVQILGRNTKLDNEIAGQALWLDFAPLFTPEAMEGGLVIPNHDTAVGAANEVTAVKRSGNEHFLILPDRLYINNLILKQNYPN